MRWSSRKKKEGRFFNVYFVRSKHFCFFLIYRVLNKLSDIYFYTLKNITQTLFCMFLKLLKAFHLFSKMQHKLY